MGVGMSSETLHTPRSNRVTIRYVATIAGVSTATVSNVVNGRGKVGRATKERVEAAIQSTKWQPNVNARNLARRFQLARDQSRFALVSHVQN